jgi:hypothetical protein
MSIDANELRAASGAIRSSEDSLRASGESSRPPRLPPNLPAWQKQKSYREARDKAIRKLAVNWYADINRQSHGDRTYPLITWSGTAPRSDRGGITGGEYLW